MMSKGCLIAENALLWMLAGFNIVRIGIQAAVADGSAVWLWSVVVFAAFVAMFSRVIKKNSMRIRALPGERLPFYRFLDVKGFAVIVFMMTLGIVLRHIGGIPNSFFAFFYTGLGAALSLSGLSSLVYLIMNRKK